MLIIITFFSFFLDCPFPIRLSERTRDRILSIEEAGVKDKRLFDEARRENLITLRKYVFPLFKDSPEYSQALIEKKKILEKSSSVKLHPTEPAKTEESFPIETTRAFEASPETNSASTQEPRKSQSSEGGRWDPSLVNPLLYSLLHFFGCWTKNFYK